MEQKCRELGLGIGFEVDSLTAGRYKVHLSDENGCQLTTTFVVDMLTSTPNFSVVEMINIYPNPTRGIFTVDLTFSTRQNFSLTLINLLGEVVIPSLDLTGENGQYTFDVGNFDNGIYLLKIESESGILTKPVVLMK